MVERDAERADQRRYRLGEHHRVRELAIEVRHVLHFVREPHRLVVRNPRIEDRPAGKRVRKVDVGIPLQRDATNVQKGIHVAVDEHADGVRDQQPEDLVFGTVPEIELMAVRDQHLGVRAVIAGVHAEASLEDVRDKSLGSDLGWQRDPPCLARCRRPCAPSST